MEAPAEDLDISQERLNTTPISIFNTHISGSWQPAGMATYAGGSQPNNMRVFACPELTVGQIYAITGTILSTAIQVEFPFCKYHGGTGPGIFTTTGWRKV